MQTQKQRKRNTPNKQQKRTKQHNKHKHKTHTIRKITTPHTKLKTTQQEITQSRTE